MEADMFSLFGIKRVTCVCVASVSYKFFNNFENRISFYWKKFLIFLRTKFYWNKKLYLREIHNNI